MMENSFTSPGKANESHRNIRSAQCRICLKNDHRFLPIFGDKAKPDISKDVVMFGGIQLNRTDDLPKHICQFCFKHLRAAILFRASAKRSEKKLNEQRKKYELMRNSKMSTKHSEPYEYKIKTEVIHTPLEENESIINPFRDKVADDTKIVEIKIEKVEASFDNFYDDVTESNDAKDNESLMKGECKGIIQKSLLSCLYCNTGFSTLGDLEEHNSTDEHKKNYAAITLPKNKGGSGTHNKKACPIQKQKRKSRLKAEKKECPDCKKSFVPSALERHVNRFHRRKTDPNTKIECPICKKMYTKFYYPLHAKHHEVGGKGNLLCDQCGKKFFLESTLRIHRLIHTNDMPFKCEYCPYRGRTKCLLKTHVRTHTGDYRYKCTQCDTRCSTKSNLNSHIQRRHRGPIDFICDACNRGFYSKITLERHISVSHLGVKDHICPTCGAAFGYRKGMMKHQTKVHKKLKGIGKPKAIYLQLEEKGLLKPLTL